MLYRYVACDAQGRSFQGVIESDSEAAAEARLWESSLIIIDLRPQADQPRPSLDWEGWLARLRPIRGRDLAELWGQLAGLLGPAPGEKQDDHEEAFRPSLSLALRLLAERSTRPSLSRLLAEVSEATSAGEPLAVALEARTTALPPLAGSLLRASEGRGELPATLRALAEAEAAVRASVAPLRRALVNAVLAMLGTAACAAFLTWVFLPLLGALETRGGAPWASASLLAVARLVQARGWPIAGAIVLLGMGLGAYTCTLSGRRLMAGIAWRMPIFGELMRARALAHLCRSLILMSEASLPWQELLDLLPHTTDNLLLQGSLLGVRSELLDGLPLSEAVRRQPIFPPSLSVVLAAAATAGPSPAGPDRAAAPSGDGATTALAVDAVRVAGGVAGEQASGAEAALPLGKLAALANYYSLQARDAAHRVAALVWRVGLGCSLAVLFWVLVGLAPAWRAAFGAGG